MLDMTDCFVYGIYLLLPEDREHACFYKHADFYMRMNFLSFFYFCLFMGNVGMKLSTDLMGFYRTSKKGVSFFAFQDVSVVGKVEQVC